MYKQHIANNGIALNYYYFYSFSSFTCYLKNADIRRNKNPPLDITCSPVYSCFLSCACSTNPDTVISHVLLLQSYPSQLGWRGCKFSTYKQRRILFPLGDVRGLEQPYAAVPVPPLASDNVLSLHPSSPQLTKRWGPCAGVWSEAGILWCD